MYKTHVIDKAFFFLATVDITENVTYSSFHSNHCKGNKFFRHNNATFQSKLFHKNGVKPINATRKNCRQGVWSSPLIRTQTLTMESKCWKITFLDFTTTYHSGFDLLNIHVLFFLNPLDSQFGRFVLKTSLKEVWTWQI